MQEKLTIGTIVKLRDLEKLFMIVGHCEKMKLKKLNKFDYFLCGYPEGVVGLKRTLLATAEDIDKVIYKGFDTNDQQVSNGGE